MLEFWNANTESGKIARFHRQVSTKPNIKSIWLYWRQFFDSELWIWGCNFGSPASMNDINILDVSSIVREIIKRNLLPDVVYTV